MIIRTATIVNRLEEGALCLVLVSMILLACLQIALRIFFSTGITWADPLLRYLVLWSGMLGAAAATRTGRHISIDLLSHLVPERLTVCLEFITALFSLAVCLILTWAAVRFTMDEAAYETGRRIIGLTSWQLNLAFPIAFGLISLRYLGELLSNLARAFSFLLSPHRPNPSEEHNDPA